MRKLRKLKVKNSIIITSMLGINNIKKIETKKKKNLLNPN